jgi:probable HAF family extracellular repeat protein
MNSANQIVGSMESIGTSTHAFLYRDGDVIDLGTFGGSGATEAYSINSMGVVVGYSSASGGNRAFRWEDGIMEDLHLPLGPSNSAYDVNDNNQIVGWMGPSVGGGARAYRWHNGVVTQLHFGPSTSAAYAINNHGDCVGFIHEQTPDGEFNKAVKWNANGTTVYLGGLAGYEHCRAWDINDDGTVIGFCYNTSPEGGEIGFIWDDGAIAELSNFVPPTFGGRPYALNNNGQIATNGAIQSGPGPWDFIPVGAVLTPVPASPGDYNCDKSVNMDDLLGVIHHWGPSGGSAADFDDDNDVDMDDLLTVLVNWG